MKLGASFSKPRDTTASPSNKNPTLQRQQLLYEECRPD
jgi:hypothetical protein